MRHRTCNGNSIGVQYGQYGDDVGVKCDVQYGNNVGVKYVKSEVVYRVAVGL